MRQEQQAIKLNYLREHNIQLILSALDAQPMSCLELSKKLSISDNGARKIIKMLEDCGAVKVSKKIFVSKKRGNPHIRYELDGKFGYFLVFNFSYYNDKFVLFDFAGNKVYESPFSYPDRNGTREQLLSLAQEAKMKLKENGFDVSKIINVTLSVSGQVDEKARCFTVSGRFRQFESDTSGSFFQIFEQTFSVPVFARNDVMYMLQGEMGDAPNKEKIVLYMFIGRGVSSALMYKGELVRGRHGYVGEIGDNRFGMDETINANVAIPCLCEKCKEYLDTYDLQGLLDAYHKRSEVKTIVQRSAVIIGIEIANIVNFLGIEMVYLGGEALGFGTEYIHTIQETARMYSRMDVQIYESSDSELAIRGALLMARAKSVDLMVGKD